MEKIIILGFSPAYLPILADAFNLLFNCKTFDVVKNIDIEEPDYPYQFKEYTFHHYRDDEYDFESNVKVPVYFGVLHSHIKYILFHYFKNNHGIGHKRYLNWFHPMSSVSKSITFETGLSASQMSVIFPFCKMGFGVNVKRNSSIGEHSNLGDLVSINPGVLLSGFVTVGDGSEIGTGASVVHDINIGKHCMIGAGSVVTKDIPDGVVAYGNPCKVIRENERWKNIKVRI